MENLVLPSRFALSTVNHKTLCISYIAPDEGGHRLTYKLTEIAVHRMSRLIGRKYVILRTCQYSNDREKNLGYN